MPKDTGIKAIQRIRTKLRSWRFARNSDKNDCSNDGVCGFVSAGPVLSAVVGSMRISFFCAW